MLETIRLVEPNEFSNYEVNDSENKKYSVTINMDASFDELTDKKHISEMIDFIKALRDINDFEEVNKIYNEEIEYLQNADENILKNVKYVYFDVELDDAVKYIEQNQELKCKNIVLNCDFDEESILNIKNIFNGNVTNIYLMIEGNTRFVSFEEAINTLNKIDSIVKEIKERNLSPFENLLATYDIVRNHEYVKENENESSGISRDLTDTLLGDKRVCVGFSQIMDIILKKLGIGSSLYSIESFNENESGHIRNMVNIKDDKYKIDGVYFCDATWDCKRNEKDTSYLHSYRYFAKTYDQMKIYDLINELKDIKLEFINKDAVSVLKSMDRECSDLELLGKIARTIRTLTYFDFSEEVFSITDYLRNKKIDFDLLDERIKKCTPRFYRPIDARKVLEAISIVREKDNLTMNDYKKIIKKSEIKFIITPEERLLMTIFTDINTNDKEAVLDYIIKETEKKLVKKL